MIPVTLHYLKNRHTGDWEVYSGFFNYHKEFWPMSKVLFSGSESACKEYVSNHLNEYDGKRINNYMIGREQLGTGSEE